MFNLLALLILILFLAKLFGLITWIWLLVVLTLIVAIDLVTLPIRLHKE